MDNQQHQPIYPACPPLPSSNDKITVAQIGSPKSSILVYIFSDVLEELLFNAQKRSAHALLSGSAYIRPDASPDPAQTPATAEKSHILVSAFSDLYPTHDPLDYADYLRRTKNFRNANTASLAPLGVAHLSPAPVPLMLEDLFLQRTYFANPGQITLFINAPHAAPDVYMLDVETSQFFKTGYFVISPKNAPLRFNDPSTC